MNYEDIVNMLEETNLPFAYDHFAEGEALEPPFICFLFPGTSNVFADNVVWQKINDLNIELYTNKKEPALEAGLEDVLTAHEFPYEKSEVWIESENMYEVLYQTQMIGG